MIQEENYMNFLNCEVTFEALKDLGGVFTLSLVPNLHSDMNHDEYYVVVYAFLRKFGICNILP